MARPTKTSRGARIRVCENDKRCDTLASLSRVANITDSVAATRLAAQNALTQISNHLTINHNLAGMKAFAASITGNSGSAPSIVSSYNIASVARSSAGVYLFTLTQQTFFGTNALTGVWAPRPQIIVSSAASPLYQADLLPISTTQFRLYTSRMFVDVAGTPHVLTSAPYDITTADKVFLIGFAVVGDGTLPKA